MAFKRSGVRLPLAPPSILLRVQCYIDEASDWLPIYLSREARGKHHGAKSIPTHRLSHARFCSLSVLKCRMAFTKGELLRHAIAFALRSVRLSGRRLGLTEDDRMRVADDALRELRRHGEWRELDDTVDSGPLSQLSGVRQTESANDRW